MEAEKGVRRVRAGCEEGYLVHADAALRAQPGTESGRKAERFSLMSRFRGAACGEGGDADDTPYRGSANDDAGQAQARDQRISWPSPHAVPSPMHRVHPRLFAVSRLAVSTQRHPPLWTPTAPSAASLSRNTAIRSNRQRPSRSLRWRQARPAPTP